VCVRERERERENDFECDEYGSCHYGTRIERLQGIRSKYVFYFVYIRFARGIILTESCRFLFLKKKKNRMDCGESRGICSTGMYVTGV
jgi:hypothetical protein